ncbi:MAG: TldD/PmbA family protein [Candidatus Cloacimonetes bacterium]|nr:TldD/PmbA family protein [Candidatus Cloacimonadota bacterium]
MISKELIAKVLDCALSNGADFAELFLENTYNSTIRFYNGKTQQSVVGKDFGIGLRVFYGKSAIYAYTSDLSEKSLLAAAEAISKADQNDKIITPRELKNQQITNIHKMILPGENVAKKDKIDFIRIIDSTARGFNERVLQVDLTLLEKKQDILIANSEGLHVEDQRNYTRIFTMIIASNDKESQTCFDGPGALAGYEFIKTLDPVKIGADTAKSAVTMLSAKYAPSGTFPVVIDNGFGGVIFHEACGHSLEATSVAKGASIFAGKLNQQIASEKVTAIDDGTIENKWGSTNIDDEGTPTQKTILIDKGILKSYMIDKLGGRKMGMESTGSGRRQSYRYAPTSRMRNTYIAPGNDKFDDMIKSIDFGLYAKKMGGGSVLPGTGNFNFSVAEGYLIQNGKIAAPVRGATLIGNGGEILKKISMVSDNLDFSEGMCGSISGSIPTCVGQPAIKVDQIIIGGR